MIVLFYEMSYASSDLASNLSLPPILNSALIIFLKILLLLLFLFKLGNSSHFAEGLNHIFTESICIKLERSSKIQESNRLSEGNY